MALFVSFDEPLIVTCPRCSGGRGDFVNPCDWCGATGGVPPDDVRLATLAHNLAIGAALCRAFWDGVRGEFARSMNASWVDLKWHPGCGHPMTTQPIATAIGGVE